MVCQVYIPSCDRDFRGAQYYPALDCIKFPVSESPLGVLIGDHRWFRAFSRDLERVCLSTTVTLAKLGGHLLGIVRTSGYGMATYSMKHPSSLSLFLPDLMDPILSESLVYFLTGDASPCQTQAGTLNYPQWNIAIVCK